MAAAQGSVAKGDGSSGAGSGGCSGRGIRVTCGEDGESASGCGRGRSSSGGSRDSVCRCAMSGTATDAWESHETAGAGAMSNGREEVKQHIPVKEWLQHDCCQAKDNSTDCSRP